MTTFNQLERRMKKLEKDVKRIKKLVGILPPLVKPLEWDELSLRDKDVLKFLIEQPRNKRFTTTQIAESLHLDNPSKVGRVYVWKSLKRIQRIARKKRQRILDYDRVAKTWALNREDFMFKGVDKNHLIL